MLAAGLSRAEETRDSGEIVGTATRSPNVCRARTNYGISDVQPSHHVAQQLTIATRPRNAYGSRASSRIALNPVAVVVTSAARTGALQLVTPIFSAGAAASPR